jgi:hypothetical protein
MLPVNPVLSGTVSPYRTRSRLFARFKLILDPMFPKLAAFVKKPECIIDVGTGYGVPAVWLLEIYPRAKVFGIEPDRELIRCETDRNRRAVGAPGAASLEHFDDNRIAGLHLVYDLQNGFVGGISPKSKVRERQIRLRMQRRYECQEQKDWSQCLPNGGKLQGMGTARSGDRSSLDG